MGATRVLLAGMAVVCGGLFVTAVAAPLNIVAVGASNTAGWGVGTQNAYPARLEAMLRHKGYDAHVVNAGVSFSTTTGMLERLDSVVRPGTSVVILQPGVNDLLFFGSKERRTANIAAIVRRMQARHIKVIVAENTIVPLNERQADGLHFTEKGHALVASWLLPRVIGAAGTRAPAAKLSAKAAD